ncbi:DUF397 domain-containing protein [Spirillospora albida]|uniref:DUF397 domain-containing protein n=1 Tax=Spirillospora albida TaxID=58123 RepID=UPI000A039DF6|nr:DUF397 domain-containing protein [Spirillospora albida]
MIASSDTHSPAAAHSGLAWRKSRRSNNGGSCVEVAVLDGTHLARDSKASNGPALAFDRPAWTQFIKRAKAGFFDLPE